MGFFRNLFRRNRERSKISGNTENKRPISHNLTDNLQTLQQLFDHTPDLITHRFPSKAGVDVALVYLDHLVDKVSINDQILNPLMYKIESVDEIRRLMVPIGKMEMATSWTDIEKSLFTGKSILLIEGQPQAFIFFTQGWPQRSIKEPQIESTLKGGHQGFVETAGMNIALVRRYLPNRELKIKEYTVGTRGDTKLYFMYLEDVIQREFVIEMEDRIQQIKVDAILNTGELEEFVEDHPMSLFPQFLLTERPDTVASQILQGRLAIVVDHSPTVMIGPATFATFFQNVDDYSIRWIVSSFLRLLRFFAFFIATSFPALYIAMISFHFEVIPLDLLMSIGVSRQKVPFPPILEALLMEISIEMLREAGLRLPAPIGQTIGVVGGIVIGQAAVEAGIVSNIMVIVVAVTAIASFIIPNHDMAAAIRLVRFPMMAIASLFGMIGIVIGWMVLFGHIMSMESLGVPYGSPISPIRFPDWKDTWIRLPLWKMDRRPLSADPAQSKRQGNSRKNREQ